MSKNKKILIAFLAVLIVKALVVVLFNDNVQTFENYAIAKNYIDTGTMFYKLDGNVDYCHQFPLYGWVLIGFRSLFGDALIPIVMFQILLGGVLSLTLIGLKRIIFPNEKREWLEVLLVIMVNFYPFLWHYQTAVIHPAMMDATLFASLLFVGMNYAIKQKRNTLDILLLVVLIGICLLERFTLIMALVPLIWLEIRRPKELLKTFILILSCVLIFLIPWMYRNYQLTGKMEMTSGIYRYLWVGIQEETDGTNTLSNGESYYELFPEDIKNSWSSRSLKSQLSFYEKSYKNTLKTQPVHVLKMWLVKLKNYFWFSKSFGSQQEMSVFVYVLLKVIRLILLFSIPLGLLGGNKMVKMIILAVFALGILQSLFYVESRHFVPAIGPLLIVLLFGFFEIKKGLSLTHAKKLD